MSQLKIETKILYNIDDNYIITFPISSSEGFRDAIDAYVKTHKLAFPTVCAFINGLD